MSNVRENVKRSDSNEKVSIQSDLKNDSSVASGANETDDLESKKLEQRIDEMNHRKEQQRQIKKIEERYFY